MRVKVVARARHVRVQSRLPSAPSAPLAREAPRRRRARRREGGTRGVVCPAGAAANVTFSVAGPGVVYGVANGDPADHSPPKAAWRLTFHGLARAIVQSSAAGAAGTISITAAASGLQPATVVIEAQ